MQTGWKLIILVKISFEYGFNALMLVGQQEGHSACKNPFGMVLNVSG